jgi:hypothetical protein
MPLAGSNNEPTSTVEATKTQTNGCAMLLS